ncbi:MAG: DUF2232 domain-containing protein [Pseudomonadota bacterium]|nr:DUF2232 domain-containing protein [Pseudomonadota bacterium]
MPYDFLLRNVIAGLVTALLTVSVLLSPFAMIPSMTVGLAWGLYSTIASIIISFILLVLWLNIGIATGMAITIGLPAIFFVRQALLSRSMQADYENTASSDADTSVNELVYYPPERLIIWAIAFCASFSFLAFGLSANNSGGLPGILQTMILSNENFIRDIETLYQVELTDNLVRILAETIIVLTPLTWMLIILGSLQTAQTIAKFFKINLRPTPDYSVMQLPGKLEYVLAGLLLLIFISSDWVSVFFLVLVCLCLTAYFLLGLAVIHAISRTWNGRGVFITAVYFIVFLVPWVAILVSITGLIESRIGIRSRF